MSQLQISPLVAEIGDIDSPTEPINAAAKILYAFFDLEICSISFDCLNWLLRAEQQRRHIGCDALHVVLVPGCKDGFSDSHLEPWVKRWRLSTIFLPACALVPSVRHVTVCGTREEAGEIEDACGGKSFPSGYTTRLYDSENAYRTATNAALDAWLLGGTIARHICGNELSVMQAPAKALCFVRDWLDKRAQGRKVIVLTLRESNHATFRNSSPDAWLEFARSLDNTRFFPVIVRDTEQVYESPQEYPGLTTCESAALNLDVRMALYETAYLNLLVNNGPVAVCYLNPRIRFIAYRFYRNSDDEGMIPYTEIYGIPYLGQIPFANEFQRVVWDEDSFDVLSTTFEDMVRRIDAAAADGSLSHRLMRRKIARDEALKIAMALHRSDRLDEAARIYMHLLDRNSTDSDVQAMLGLLLHHRGYHESAVKFLEGAIARRPNAPNFHFNLGVVYRQMGDLRRAEDAFRKAVELDSEFSAAQANLADLNRRKGDSTEAEKGYCRALALGAMDARTIFECASTLLANGKAAAANQIFERLGVRYFRHEEKRIDQSVKEIPQIENYLRLTPRRYIAPGAKNGWTDDEL